MSTQHKLSCLTWTGLHRSLGSGVRPSIGSEFGRRLLSQAAGLLPRHGELQPGASTLSGTWRPRPVAMGTRSEAIRTWQSDGSHRVWRFGVRTACLRFTAVNSDHGLVVIHSEWWRDEPPGADVERLCVSDSYQSGSAHFSFSPWPDSSRTPDPNIHPQLVPRSPRLLHPVLLSSHRPLASHASKQL